MDSRSTQPPLRVRPGGRRRGDPGTAVARELVTEHPDARVVVLEAERHLGWHQTGRSSGVIHAGIYYEPGSLKARLCVEGARSLYVFCAEREIPHRRSGKLIVAVDEGEVERLDELERRGQANRVPGLRRLGPARWRRSSPTRAESRRFTRPRPVWSTSSGSPRPSPRTSPERGSIHLDTRVTRAEPGRDRIAIGHSRGVTSAAAAVFCAGLWSDRLAVACGAPADPRIVPFRGGYLRLRPAEAVLVRANVYPVPDPELPFLGAHLTRTLDGNVLVGPSALMVAPGTPTAQHRPARDLGQTLAWPGTWRIGGAPLERAGISEIRHAASSRSFLAEAARIVPGTAGARVDAGPAGIQAQALGRDGQLVDDLSSTGPSGRSTSATLLRPPPHPRSPCRADRGRGPAAQIQPRDPELLRPLEFRLRTHVPITRMRNLGASRLISAVLLAARDPSPLTSGPAPPLIRCAVPSTNKGRLREHQNRATRPPIGRSTGSGTRRSRASRPSMSVNVGQTIHFKIKSPAPTTSTSCGSATTAATERA